MRMTTVVPTSNGVITYHITKVIHFPLIYSVAQSVWSQIRKDSNRTWITNRRRHLEYSLGRVVVGSDIVVGWDPMGYIPSDRVAYIP